MDLIKDNKIPELLAKVKASVGKSYYDMSFDDMFYDEETDTITLVRNGKPIAVMSSDTYKEMISGIN